MKKKIATIYRKPKKMYYVDGDGQVWERDIKHGGKEKVSLYNYHGYERIKRKPRHLYYIDGRGNVMESPMKRRR